MSERGTSPAAMSAASVSIDSTFSSYLTQTEWIREFPWILIEHRCLADLNRFEFLDLQGTEMLIGILQKSTRLKMVTSLPNLLNM
jgi:hypothetical protein